MEANVESHQPLPEHQHVSSGGVFRRKDRTFLKSPRLNATVNFSAVSSSRAPTQGMNIAGHTKRASKPSPEARVINSIHTAPGMPPGPSAGVSGKSNRPFGRKASSQISSGAVAPALT